MSKIGLLILSLIALFILFGASAMTPSHVLAGGVNCSASPSTVVIGGTIHIECAGFDANTIVNSYVVETTGFSEVGRPSYAGCLTGTNGAVDSADAKTNETGIATYNWFTQDGSGTCALGFDHYQGYANQLGTFTVVVQELDGKGGIKAIGKVDVTITGNGKTFTGALLGTSGPAISGGALFVYGSGFAPNEFVNIWFTRPQTCSGLGDWFYTGVSAFSPENWSGGGVSGAGSIKADSSGNFTGTYALHEDDSTPNAYPCLGHWHVTAYAPASKLGGESEFVIDGNSIAENAKVWTTENSVSSYDQTFADGHNGVAVHVNGSGFPAGSVVNCWFTRPDGTVYNGDNISGTFFGGKVGADGTFAGVTLTYSSERGYQGEQPGTWAVTCGTADGKYTGIARFVVYPLPFIDP